MHKEINEKKCFFMLNTFQMLDVINLLLCLPILMLLFSALLS